ncbi:hypothetical protein [Bacillus sp. AFS040349]|uniref:hypothetical protein n=1 Tax=Bacillus sp. AFS040349 TaxID=2033502 RepID=UPI00159BCBFF|nr:hypothetical protein [Bacillus sp. AFS040349]
MLNVIKRRKRIKLFSQRSKLKEMNQRLEKAALEQDVAWVEELMEEKRRLIDSLL